MTRQYALVNISHQGNVRGQWDINLWYIIAIIQKTANTDTSQLIHIITYIISFLLVQQLQQNDRKIVKINKMYIQLLQLLTTFIKARRF